MKSPLQQTQSNTEGVKQLFRILIAEDDAAEFLSIIKPMFNQILGNSIANRRLTELRDALLPRLMTGEVDVSRVDI